MRPGAAGAAARPGWVRRLRGISINNWLIIACVAVFLLDVFVLPRRWVDLGTEWAKGVDPAAAQAAPLTRGEIVPAVPGGVSAAKARQGVQALSDGAGALVGVNIYERVPFLYSFGYFSTSRALVSYAPDGPRGFEFWRFVGFQFLHGSMVHLLFNMVGLWFFGPLVEHALGGKRYLAFYLLCGIFGAIFYLGLNLLGNELAAHLGPEAMKRIPALLFNDPRTPLVGASAGVFGVLIAGAKLAPNVPVLVFGVIPMRLATMAYVMVGIALLKVFIGADNAGGEAAHLGGAAAGWYFIRNPHHLHGFFNFMGRVDPTSRTRRLRAAADHGDVTRGEVDRILAKVSREGLQSLTAEERAALRRASGR